MLGLHILLKRITSSRTKAPGAKVTRPSATCITTHPTVNTAYSALTSLLVLVSRSHRARAAGHYGVDCRDGKSNRTGPGNDGIWFIGYKVTNPSASVWHYEYAVYNQNLDRAIQSLSVPLGPGANISNIGFTPRLSNPVGSMMAPWKMLDIAARRGMLLKTQAQSLGARKLSRLIKMQMRFASPRFITSALTPINRRKLPTRQ